MELSSCYGIADVQISIPMSMLRTRTFWLKSWDWKLNIDLESCIYYGPILVYLHNVQRNTDQQQHSQRLKSKYYSAQY